MGERSFSVSGSGYVCVTMREQRPPDRWEEDAGSRRLHREGSAGLAGNEDRWAAPATRARVGGAMNAKATIDDMIPSWRLDGGGFDA